jgi:tripartite-type tricarboxylate transporter receptor subunit TctC
MQLIRTNFTAFLVAASMFGACAPHAAETYPSKPGRLILPFGAGGSTDIVGRIFAQRFSEAWGQTLVVDNRAGAAGIIGTELAAKSAPDGYTIFTYGINQAVTPALYKNLPYDHQRDFMLLSLYATMPNILCVTPSLPVTTAGEFVKFVKASPGKYKYASSGVGASPHLTMELFKSVTGIDIVHVPYKNSSQGYIDTIAGEIQGFFFNLPGPLPYVKAGRLRALAVTSTKRAEQLPNVPTILESGIRDFEVTVWQGYALPKGTPRPIFSKVYASMMKAFEAPELKQRFFDNGVTAAPITPAEFTKFVAVETTKWHKVVTLSGTKVE